MILLLLVMDKKAKKAALEKAYEAAWIQSKNLQAKTDADKQNLDNEKTAWIKLKSEKHEELLKKEAALEREIALLKFELSQLDKNQEKSKSEPFSDDLLKKEIVLKNEKSKVQILAKKLELEKSNADKNLKETKDLTEKIASMELILKEMKSSLDKDKFAYSIVPYFGKNGLNRKPLYIECNDTGILFFPDKTLIPSDDESDNLKNEIINRTSLLREYLQQTLSPKESTPYLMLLVRPGGITNYWKLQSIIKPMDIDFGYELVDKIWVLDIPTEQSAPSPSKLASMIKPMQIPKPIPAPGNIRGGINNGNGNVPQQNNDSAKTGIYQNGNEKRNGSTGNAKSISYGATATNIRPITALPGFPDNKNSTNTLVKNNPTLINNQNGTGSGNNNSNNVGLNNTNTNGNGAGNINPNNVGSGNSNLNGNGAGNINPNNVGSGNSNLNGNGAGNINPNNVGSGNSNQNSNGAGNINPNNVGAGNSNQNSNGASINNPNMNSNLNNKNENQTNTNNQTIGKSNKSTTDINQNNYNQNDQAGINSGNTKSINKGNDSSGNGTTSNSSNNGAGGVPGSKGSYSVATTPNSFADGNSNGQKGTGNNSSGEEKTTSNTNNSKGSPGQKGDEPNSTSKKESTKSAIGSNGQDSQPTNQDQNPSISISLNNNKNEQNVTNKQSAPRTTYNREDESQSNNDAQDPTARIAAPLPELGPRKSRDWVIYVECKFEEILVHPNRLVIPTSLLASEEGVKRFVQEIEKMITRKQSTVRAGEPPYRPEVRFLVWPDGLKPYHLSYPALQLAGIKQKRQNLESEDSIKEIIQGR
ncbi:MAG: hypothetical protein NTV50_14050 [Planctomycetota bacterium]|nr:hypothetical protein [Planctomycetota bacterium]